MLKINKRLRASKKDKYVIELSFDHDVDASFFNKKSSIVSSDESDLEDKVEGIHKTRKLTKAEKREKERIEEIKLRQAEEELIKNDPKTADQFDRLLLGQPNNSSLWIKYMSFYLQATEFEKVKAVARRALQTIDVREEQEKMNIWIALLNLENIYGTKESLKSCLQEAVRMNDDYAVYGNMLKIYVASNKSQDVNELVSKMCKKYKDNLECWLKCAESLFRVNEPAKARALFQRSLASLSKKEHITMISRFALLENQFGYTQEAQTLFEHILTSYPARVDIWNCYVDMLVKSNLITIARNVLERACSQSLPARKMKSIYAKRLHFEEKYGDESDVKNVKTEAQKYVNELTKNLNN